MAANVRTRSQLEAQLARLMGDAASDGTPSFAKWSITEYRDALDFAIQSCRKDFLIPYAGTITWSADDYDYPLPDADLVYVHTIRAESGTSVGTQFPVVGSGLYEYWVPMEIVTPQRIGLGSMGIHFDKNEVSRHNLNQASLKFLVEGYKYQPLLTASADECRIPFDYLLLQAKNYMHLSAVGRDPNDLMKHMRQWQAVVTEITSHDEEEIIEVPGGIWLDGR